MDGWNSLSGMLKLTTELATQQWNVLAAKANALIPLCGLAKVFGIILFGEDGKVDDSAVMKLIDMIGQMDEKLSA